METLRALLLNIQKNIVMRRVGITRLFWVAEALLVLLFVYTFMQVSQDYSAVALFLAEWGGRLGVIATIAYVLTLLPGCITRLQWWPHYTQPIAGMLLPFRRHLGILMFLLVYLHMQFTTFFPQLAGNNFDPSKIQLMLFQQLGYAAWLLLLPLWLTSNDFSQRKLGTWWKRLHRLTYVVLFLSFMHTALIQASWMYLLGAVGILELLSWIIYWRRSRVLVAAPVA
jgi:DMSO/TMAO reductase YedYZ heme-binding membrane subunit